MTDNDAVNTEYQTLPAGSETPSAEGGETPATPEATPAPAPQPAAPNPEFEAMKAEMASMRERERELMALLGRQPQPAQPTQSEPDYRELISQSFGEKTAPALTKILEVMEARIAKRYAAREDLEQVRNATSAVVATTVERQAMDTLRGMKVAEADIQTVHERARKELEKLNRQGIAVPPMLADMLYKSKLAELQAERGTAAADAAIAAKGRVDARAQKNGLPSSPAPTGTPKIELTDDELEGSFMDLLRNPKLTGKKTA